ncbi:MAG: ABC transporter substrate-binding protein, partial [Phycisphaerae bacterium]|nr:ABC transporter substrate-binding protein [Phycisphaerae bacterium]
LYDFETLRRTVMYNQYVRINSFFPGSDFGSSGPPTAAEIAVLEPYRDQLPPEVFSKPFEPPQTDGRGNIRNNLRQALRLFKAAGWQLKNGKL